MPRTARLLTAVLTVIVAVTVIVVASGACGDDEDGGQDLTWAQLRNLAYPSALAEGETVQLEDGFAAAKEGTMPTARLVDVGAFGDLGGDDGIDAAVFLAETVSDTQQVTTLMAVVHDRDGASIEGSAELGNDVAIRSVTISDGVIAVDTLAAGSVDAVTGEAPVLTRRFELERSGLEMADEITGAVIVSAPEEFEYAPEILDPASENALLDVSLKPRGIAPFLVYGTEGESFSISLSSQHDSAVLSIQGLSDESQALSFRDYATEFETTFPTTQAYFVNVRSVLGSDLDVTIDYQLTAPPEPTATPQPTPVPAPVAPPGTPGELALAIPQLFTGTPGFTDAALGDVSSTAAAFVPGRAPLNGSAVVVPNDGFVYGENADQQMETASVIKVVVMTCVMARAEQLGRLVSEWELSLMWPMITYSDNDATDALWSDLGGGPGVASCLQALGVGGITPYNGPYWGTSTASARGMATLMSRIAYGDIVNAEHRAAALAMLVSVVADQRWGVPAGADTSGEEIVGVKDGWYPDDDGWRVNSVGFITPLTPGQSPYAIAVMTNEQTTQEYGIATIEGIAEPVWIDLR